MLGRRRPSAGWLDGCMGRAPGRLVDRVFREAERTKCGKVTRANRPCVTLFCLHRCALKSAVNTYFNGQSDLPTGCNRLASRRVFLTLPDMVAVTMDVHALTHPKHARAPSQPAGRQSVSDILGREQSRREITIPSCVNQED